MTTSSSFRTNLVSSFAAWHSSWTYCEISSNSLSRLENRRGCENRLINTGRNDTCWISPPACSDTCLSSKPDPGHHVVDGALDDIPRTSSVTRGRNEDEVTRPGVDELLQTRSDL